MKVNLSVMSSNMDYLKKLGNLDFGTPKLNFKFAHVLKKINEEVKLFMEQQLKTVHKYGKENTDGSFSVKQDQIEKFQKELAEFNSIDCEIDWEKVDIPLGKFIGITPVEMNFFDEFFINIVEEEND